MRTLNCFEFNNPFGHYEDVINVEDFLCDKLLKDIEERIKNCGLVISISQMISSEKFIRAYYENLGYTVFKSSSESTKLSNFLVSDEAEKGIFGTNHVIISSIDFEGVPDFFCWKNKQDFFFVEAKSYNDGVRANQLKWIFKFKFYTKIIFLLEDSLTPSTNKGKMYLGEK